MSDDELARWAEETDARTPRYQVLQAEVGRWRAAASSADGTVTVTADSGGSVTGLRIAGDDQLAADILEAVRKAHSRIPDLVAEVIAAAVSRLARTCPGRARPPLQKLTRTTHAPAPTGGPDATDRVALARCFHPIPG